MRLSAAIAALVLLCACATQLPQVVVYGSHSFAVRFDPRLTAARAVDEIANQQCGARQPAVFLEQQTRFDGFEQRVYNCEGS